MSSIPFCLGGGARGLAFLCPQGYCAAARQAGPPGRSATLELESYTSIAVT